jgi:hypothetical protein
MSASSPTAEKAGEQELPLGTAPAYARMHTWFKRLMFACLIAMAIEGTLTLPGLLIYYGWPTLSLTQICSELGKVSHHNDTFECTYPYPLSGPPFGGKSESADQDTTHDTWGVQPMPHYPRLGFRELVRIHDERLARQAAASHHDAPH